MRIEELAGLRVCILGFGREGQATLRALRERASCAEIIVADRGEGHGADGCDVRTGADYLDRLDDCDVVIKSPGIPPCPELLRLGDRVTSATDLFLHSVKSSGATLIGVTGSKGKSTTSSLIYAALKAAELPVELVGNIGVPALDHLNRAVEGSLFVVELSSYQLLQVTTSPQIAVLTSYFQEHLDYHGSLEAYWNAKANIVRWQGADDAVFFNSRFEECRAMADLSAGARYGFSDADCPVRMDQTRLIGLHNASNIAAAFQVASYLKVQPSVSVGAIESFQGLPHRLQSLGAHDGAEWVDDAISTTPESTIAALDALGDRVDSIILGGHDRGYQFEGLAQRIADSA